MTSWIWIILSRWVHLLSACLLIGATFFFAGTLGKSTADAESGEGVLVSRSRRFLQMLGRTAIVLLLATGIYNLLLNRIAYEHTLPLSHVLLGLHALFWLVIAAAIEVALSRRTRTGRRDLLGITIALMFLTVAIASGLKYVREHPATSANAAATRQSADMAGGRIPPTFAPFRGEGKQRRLSDSQTNRIGHQVFRHAPPSSLVQMDIDPSGSPR